MTGRRNPVREDLAADIKRIDRDLEDLTKPGKVRTASDQATLDALLETRHRLTELAKRLSAGTSVPEGTS